MASNAITLVQRPDMYIDLSEFYNSNALKLIIKRHCHYLQENPYGGLSDRLVPITWMAAGGFVGYCVATKATEQFENAKARLAVQGTGVVMGCGAGAYAYTQIKEKDVFFKAWKELKLEEATNECVFETFKNDPLLNQFIDCVHFTPIRVPVRLRSGHLMDLDTFYRIKPNQDGDFICPYSRTKLDLAHPNIDFETQCLILKRLQHLIKHEIIHLKENTLELKALEMQLQVIENKLNKVYTKHLQGIEQLLRDGKITQLECDSLRSEFYNDFGVNPSGEGIPERRVRPHAMDFTLDWKAIIKSHSLIIFKGTPETQFMEEV